MIVTLENILSVAYNTKHTLTYELAITPLSIHQSELKYIHTKTCSRVNTAAVLKIAQNWETTLMFCVNG